jgi:hypothetical protein
MSDKKRFSRRQVSNLFSSNKPGFVSNSICSDTNRIINRNINRVLGAINFLKGGLIK